MKRTAQGDGKKQAKTKREEAIIDFDYDIIGIRFLWFHNRDDNRKRSKMLEAAFRHVRPA